MREAPVVGEGGSFGVRKEVVPAATEEPLHGSKRESSPLVWDSDSLSRLARPARKRGSARRRLAEPCPNPIPDARYGKVRDHGMTGRRAAWAALGDNWEGRRQVLAVGWT